MNNETLHKAGVISYKYRRHQATWLVIRCAQFACVCNLHFCEHAPSLFRTRHKDGLENYRELPGKKRSSVFFFLICLTLTLFLTHLPFCFFKRLTIWLITTSLLFTQRNSSSFHPFVDQYRVDSSRYSVKIAYHQLSLLTQDFFSNFSLSIPQKKYLYLYL